MKNGPASPPLSFGPNRPTKGKHATWEEKARAMGVFLLTLKQKTGPPDTGGWRWTGSSGMWSASPRWAGEQDTRRLRPSPGLTRPAGQPGSNPRGHRLLLWLEPGCRHLDSPLAWGAGRDSSGEWSPSPCDPAWEPVTGAGGAGAGPLGPREPLPLSGVGAG